MGGIDGDSSVGDKTNDNSYVIYESPNDYEINGDKLRRRRDGSLSHLEVTRGCEGGKNVFQMLLSLLADSSVTRETDKEAQRLKDQ